MLARATLFASALALHGCGAARRDYREFDGTWEHAATRTETQALSIVAGGELSIEIAAGDVVVRTDRDAEPSVRATFEVLSSVSDAHAFTLAASCSTSIAKEGEVTRIRTELGALHGALTGESRTRVSLAILVPPGVSVEARSGEGDVRLDGGTLGLGPSRAIAAIGDAEISGARGGAEATTTTGRASATGCQGGEVTARSTLGDVRVEGVEAERVEAATHTGRVLVADSRADVFRATAESGGVALTDIVGAVEAACSTGEVSLSGAAAPRAELHSGFGPVRAERVAGDVEATSTNGPVTLLSVAGSVQADCGYGEVRISGALRALDVHCGTGDVHATAFPGSDVPEGGWSLRSDLGDIELGVPPRLGVSLDARTLRGEVSCELPCALEAGASPALGRLRGSLAGGGPEVLLETGGGDVRVFAAEAAP